MSEEQSKESREILDGCSAEDSKEIQQIAATIVRGEFSGPIPPPSVLAEYEKMIPGSADRILTMAERQSDHRQKMEAKMIDAESRDSFCGVVFAFSIGVVSLIIGAIMAIKIPNNGGTVIGTIFGMSGVGSIVGTFLNGTRINHKNVPNDEVHKEIIKNEDDNSTKKDSKGKIA